MTLKSVTVIYPYGSFGAEADTLLPIEIPEQGSTLKNLEYIYRAMNRVDGSQIEANLDKYKVRSMCAGDMVRMDGKLYICDGTGWKVTLSSMGLVEVTP